MKLNVIIEIPKNSNVKYEYDSTSKKFIVDRVLYGPHHYPQNYGFIENTLDYDADPLDVLVISGQPLITGCIVPCRIVGGMEMVDDGEIDTKLIGVIDCDPRFSNIESMSDVNINILNEIRHFFETYKILQKKKVSVHDWVNKEKAMTMLKECQTIYGDYKHLISDKEKLKNALIKAFPDKTQLK